MQGRVRQVSATLLVAGAALATAAALPAAERTDADQRAAALNVRAAELGERSSNVLLELYALDSRLVTAVAAETSADEAVAAVERERTAMVHRLAIARQTLEISQRSLAERVLAAYQRGATEPLELLLGESSLDDALSHLDGLAAIARQDREIAAQAKAARHQLRALSRSHAQRKGELSRLETAAAARASELVIARADRLAYLGRLAGELDVTKAQLDALQREARAARALAVRLTQRTPAAATTVRVGTLQVTATGYAIRGRTATGITTAVGIVAVDPSVIPLGTRLSIPGYGPGVAADVGPGIRGAAIDLWFSTRARAREWGRRTVTVHLS